jgi:4-amino-4-deoxy-L-arabinose transferase-like glycosyltransferase
MDKASWVSGVVLVVAVIVSFFTGLGGVPLFDKDEGAFCEATREMLVSGNYIMPYLNGEPRYDKPILIYWLQAASVKIFGLTEFALRLPSALAAAAWALVTYRFVRRVLDTDRAFLATFFLVTALQVTIIAKAAIADAVLNCFIAISMFCFYRFHESGLRKHFLAGMAATALGTLTKGPVAILIPVATTFVFCLLQKDLKRWLKTLIDPLGILLFLVIAAPWHVVAILDQGRPILDAWILKQSLGRFHHPLEGHSGSIVYYVPVLLVGVIPYTALLFKVLRNVRSDFKEPLRQYLLIWFVFVFVFFSFSGTKLPHYIIYGYTPLFILMAIHLDRLRSDLLLLLPTLALMGFLLVLPHAMPLVIPRIRDEFARIVAEESLHEFNWSYQVPVVAGLILVLAAALVRAIPRKVKIVALGLVVTLLINLDVMPLVGRITQEPIRQAAAIATERDYDVFLWKLNMPSFIFYRQKLTPKGFPQPGDVVLTKIQLMRKLAEYDPIYQDHGIILARVTRILSYVK